MRVKTFDGPVENRLPGARPILATQPMAQAQPRPRPPDAGMPLARTSFSDDDEVLVEILSPPNAIGICQVRHLDRTLARHHARLKPHNEAAVALLAQADRFVRRDARVAVSKTPETPQIRGWTLEEVEQLRLYLISETDEYQFLCSHATKSTRDSYKLAITRSHAAIRYVTRWLKEERNRLAARKAGLCEGEEHNSDALLSRLREVAYRLHREATAAGLPGMTEEERALLNVANNQLAFRASVSKETMPEPESPTT